MLMYHRVLPDLANDPFDMAVSLTHFSEQMAVLGNLAKVISSDDLIQPGQKAFSTSEACVCVTFDDGYVDNLEHALPILERHNIPATVFLATDYIGAERPFWWDEVDALLRRLAQASRRVSDGTETWDLSDVENVCAARDVLTQKLKRMSGTTREHWLDTFCREHELARECATPDSRPISWEEARTVAAGGILSFEAHGCSHASVGFLAEHEAGNEIRESKRVIDTELRKNSRLFAYPNGKAEDIGTGLEPAFEDAGIAGAFTTTSGAIQSDASVYRLPRVGIRDCDAAAFAARLQMFLPSI